MRKATVKQLEKAGIIYDQLIMGIGGGQRYLINDLKPGRDYDTAISFNLKRDKGIKDKFPDIDINIKNKIKTKLNKLYE